MIFPPIQNAEYDIGWCLMMTSRVKTVTKKVELRNVLKMQTAGQRNVIKLLKLSNTNFF